MGNSLRCCLACMLPCGAFDVVYVVDLSGHVECYGGYVTAGEIPGRILSKPCSQRVGGARGIKIVSPESELKRGCIYYLVAASGFPAKKHAKHTSSSAVSRNECDYLLEMLPERRSGHYHGMSSRIRVWRPRLESICEDV